MSIEHLKEAPKTSTSDSGDVRRFAEAQQATNADIMLEKYFPKETFDLSPAD